MIRKVMAGEELLRAAGTVTKKLARWLGDRQLVDTAAAAVAAERAGDAARDLPKECRRRLLPLLQDSRRWPEKATRCLASSFVPFGG